METRQQESNKAVTFNDNNGTFVVAGSVTFLYIDLRYRDEVTVWAARNLSSVTGKVQQIFLFHRPFRSAGKGEIFT
jgi:hypothetical protein